MNPSKMQQQLTRKGKRFYDRKNKAHVTLTHESGGTWYGKWESGLIWPVDTGHLIPESAVRGEG